MNNLQFIVISIIALAILVGMAEFLATAHAPERKKCLDAGYEWSATKYVCIVHPK